MLAQEAAPWGSLIPAKEKAPSWPVNVFWFQHLGKLPKTRVHTPLARTRRETLWRPTADGQQNEAIATKKERN